MSTIWRLSVFTLALLLAVPSQPLPVLAQQQGSPGRSIGTVTALQGQASVTRVALPQPSPLHFKDSVYFRDQIATRERSTVRLLLGGKGTLTIREQSQVTLDDAVTGEGKSRSVISLLVGKIGAAIARGLMSPGEEVEVRTPNAVAAVRGTVFVAEYIPPAKTAEAPKPVLLASSAPGPFLAQAPAAGGTSNFFVLSGSVTVTVQGQAPVSVGAMQSVSVTVGAAGTQAGPVQQMSQSQVQQATQGLEATKSHTSETSQTAEAQAQVATVVADAVTGGAGGGTGEGAAPSEAVATGNTRGVTEIIPEVPTAQPLLSISNVTLGLTSGTALATFGAGVPSAAPSPVSISGTGIDSVATVIAPIVALTGDPGIGYTGLGLASLNNAAIVSAGGAPIVGVSDATVSIGGGPLLELLGASGLEAPSSVLALGGTASATVGGVLSVAGTSDAVLGSSPAVDVPAGTALTSGGSLFTVASTSPGGTGLEAAGSLASVGGALMAPGVLSVNYSDVLLTGGPILESSGATLAFTGPMASVTGSGAPNGTLESTGSGPLFDLSGGSLALTGGGSLLKISADLVSAQGPVLIAAGTAIHATGSTAPLVGMTGSSVLEAGDGSIGLVGLSGGATLEGGATLLSNQGGSANLSGAVLDVAGGSTVSFSGGPAVWISGGSLWASYLLQTDGSNSITLSGTVLKLDGATATLTALWNHPGGDAQFFTLPLNQPFVEMTGSSLTLTEAGGALAGNLTAGGEYKGTVLKAANSSGKAKTLSLLGPIYSADDGGAYQATAPLIDLGGMTVGTDVAPLVEFAGGSTTLTGPLFSAAGSGLTSGGLLALHDGAGLTSGGTGSLFAMTGGSLSTVAAAKPAFDLSMNSALGLSGPLFQGSNAALALGDSLLTISSGASIMGNEGAAAFTLVGLAGGSLSIPETSAGIQLSGGTLSLPGSLVQASGTSFTVGSGTAGFLDVASGSSVSVGGSLLDLSGSLNLDGRPLLNVSGASAVAVTGPAVKLGNGTLTASYLVNSDASGNTLTFRDSVLTLTNASATLQGLGNDTSDQDVYTLALAANRPVVQMSNSNLTLTEPSTMVGLGGETGSFAGVALVATNTGGGVKTIQAGWTLFAWEGGDLTATDPLIQLSNMTVSQTAAAPLVSFSDPLTPPAVTSMTGPILKASGGQISAELLFYVSPNHELTGNAPGGAVRLDGTTLNANMVGEVSGVLSFGSTAGSLLVANSSTLNLTDALIVVESGGILQHAGSGTPLLSLSGGALNLLASAETQYGGSLLALFDAEGSLAGSLLSATGTTVNGSATSAPLVYLSGASLGVSTAQPLVKLAGATGSLTLGSPLLQASSSSVVSLEGPVLETGGRPVTGLTPQASLVVLESSTLSLGTPGTEGGDGYDPVPATGSSLLVSQGSALSFTGPMVQLWGGDSLHSYAATPLFSLAGGSLTFPQYQGEASQGGLLYASSDLVEAAGDLLQASGTAIDAKNSGRPLVLLDASAELHLGGHLIRLAGGKLEFTTPLLGLLNESYASLQGSLLKTTGGAVVTGSGSGGVLASVSAASLELGAPLLDSTGSPLTFGGPLVALEGGAELWPSYGESAVSWSLYRVDGGTLTLTGEGALLAADNASAWIDGALLSATKQGAASAAVVNATGATGPLVHLSNGAGLYLDDSLNSGGNLARLSAGAQLTTVTPLALVESGSAFQASGGSLASLVLVDGTGSKFTATGTVLDVQDAAASFGESGSADTGGPIFAFRNKSQGTFQGGSPLVRVWGSSVGFTGATLYAEGGFGDSDGTGNVITINGTGVPVGSAVMLDAKNATISFGSGGFGSKDSDLDVFSVSAPAGVPLYRLDGVRLEDGSPDRELLSFSNGPTVASNTSTFNGLLLIATNGSEIATGGPLLGLWEGQVVTSTAKRSSVGDPLVKLIEIDNSHVTVSQGDVLRLSGASSLTLSSILLEAGTGVSSTVTAETGAILRVTEGSALIGQSLLGDPLLLFSSTVVTAQDGVAVAQGSGSRIALGASPLLVATNGSTLQSGGPLVGITNGATVTSASSDSLVGLTNGTSLKSQAGLDFASPVIGLDNSGLRTTDQDWGTNTARDLKMTGSGSPVKVDAALLTATAPVIAAIRSAIEATGSGSAGAIDFNNASGATIGLSGYETSAVWLNNSFLQLHNGPLMAVRGGSTVDLAGDFATLMNGSKLFVNNGPLILVDGAGSQLNVSGGLINFIGTGSQVFVKNGLTPTDTQYGIPVSGSNISVNTSTPVKNGTIQSGTAASGSNTLTINPGSSVIRTSGGGTVNIGKAN